MLTEHIHEEQQPIKICGKAVTIEVNLGTDCCCLYQITMHHPCTCFMAMGIAYQYHPKFNKWIVLETSLLHGCSFSLLGPTHKFTNGSGLTH